MGKHKFFIIFLSALLALIVVPLAISADQKVIKIGALYPMTGRAGIYGLDSVDAAEMAIEEINSKGELPATSWNLLTPIPRLSLTFQFWCEALRPR
jgi:hypothetical protein